MEKKGRDVRAVGSGRREVELLENLNFFQNETEKGNKNLGSIAR